LDWALGVLFPRDIAELRLYTERGQHQTEADAGLVPGTPALTQAPPQA
jgi:hypothetical protein